MSINQIIDYVRFMESEGYDEFYIAEFLDDNGCDDYAYLSKGVIHRR